jgi:hypothetical protein
MKSNGGNMEDRLLPLNAVVGLVTPHDPNPAVLHDAGFRLVGLETPMRGQASRVTVDAILLHQDTNHLLLCEAKSGANVDESQAVRYAALDPTSVVQSAYVTLPTRVRPTAEVVYVCTAEHVARVKLGLAEIGAVFPLLAVHRDKIALEASEFAGRALLAAFPEGGVRLNVPIPEILPFDHDSPKEVIRSAVEAELIACLAHKLPQVTFSALAERIAPYLGIFGHAARKRFVKNVGAVCRDVAADDMATFSIDLPGPNREGLIRFLRTPEQYDTRGRTPAYKSLLQRRPRRGEGLPVAHAGQLNLLDLLDEVDNGDEDEATGEEVDG